MKPTGLNSKVMFKKYGSEDQTQIGYDCTGGASDILSHTLCSNPVCICLRWRYMEPVNSNSIAAWLFKKWRVLYRVHPTQGSVI